MVIFDGHDVTKYSDCFDCREALPVSKVEQFTTIRAVLSSYEG